MKLIPIYFDIIKVAIVIFVGKKFRFSRSVRKRRNMNNWNDDFSSRGNLLGCEGDKVQMFMDYNKKVLDNAYDLVLFEGTVVEQTNHQIVIDSLNNSLRTCLENRWISIDLHSLKFINTSVVPSGELVILGLSRQAFIKLKVYLGIRVPDIDNSLILKHIITFYARNDNQLVYNLTLVSSEKQCPEIHSYDFGNDDRKFVEELWSKISAKKAELNGTGNDEIMATLNKFDENKYIKEGFSRVNKPIRKVKNNSQTFMSSETSPKGTRYRLGEYYLPRIATRSRTRQEQNNNANNNYNNSSILRIDPFITTNLTSVVTPKPAARSKGFTLNPDLIFDVPNSIDFTYPVGKQISPTSVQVTSRDVNTMKPGKWLNDVMIDFYLKYICDQVLLSTSNSTEDEVKFEDDNRSQNKKAMSFSPFFFSKLKQLSVSENGFKELLNWTKNLDIFDKDLLIIPINECSHWYVILISHPGLEEAEFRDGKLVKSTTILVNDSLFHKQHSQAADIIKYWLEFEWNARYPDGDRDFNGPHCVIKNKVVPRQQNSNDCGVHVLQLVENVLKQFIDTEIIKIHFGNILSHEEIKSKRKQIVDVCIALDKEYKSLKG